jgi:arginine utilization protein RocB
MAEVQVSQLKQAVESQHGCTAELVQAVPVKETFGGKAVWEGIVHVFKIYGHPKAHQAYAWSSPIEGSDKRRFFVVLHVPPITSPVEAVRAAIVAENRGNK